MAGSIRNRVKVQLGSESYTLAATFGAMEQIEAKTAKTMGELVNTAGTLRGLSTGELTTILSEASKAAESQLDDVSIVRLLEDYGVMGVQNALHDFFVVAHYGGDYLIELSKKKKQQGQPKATGSKTTTESP